MSLDRSKLRNLRELGSGGCQAQCPACAEAGQDKKGEHLRMSADGRFGCCVFPGDREHRRRIFALAGDHGPKPIRVRVAEGKAGRVGRRLVLNGDWSDVSDLSDGSDGVTTVQTEFEQVRTSRTVELESETITSDKSRTARTGYHLVTRNADELNSVSKLKEFEEPVRSVRNEKPRLPYLTSSGDLVIPFDSPERYHWWKGGQSPDATKRELLERKENDAAPF